MQDKSSYSNNSKPQISEILQNFINAMVEEIVLKGETFDHMKKKYLKKYSEAEGVNYEELEGNLNDFLELLEDYRKTQSNALKRVLTNQASACFIADALLDSLMAAKPITQTPPQANHPQIDWVDIPAGTFTMGSPSREVDRGSDETQHQVTLSAFEMSKYTITFEQYDAFCEATNHEKPDDNGWGRGKRPVINVSWHDATAFCEWLSKQTGKIYRLPTEAEWEYACRAGTTTPFNTGNNLTTEQANYNGNYPYNNNSKGKYIGKTMPVGNFKPNAWGLYDMHGNVWEWCSDWFGKYSTSAQTNPKGPSTGSNRVLRGGSWIINARNCRVSGRISGSPGSRNSRDGFRVVLSQ
jgi:formylglycine-generating enzyme